MIRLIAVYRHDVKSLVLFFYYLNKFLNYYGAQKESNLNQKVTFTGVYALPIGVVSVEIVSVTRIARKLKLCTIGKHRVTFKLQFV